MAILVESGCAEPAGSWTLRAMFEDRKSVFVDLLKWDVPVLCGRFELDQFDDEHATYLIIADEDGDHLASARLLPTTRPHILGSLFPDLCAAPPPAGPWVFEITRFCLSRRQGAASRRLARNPHCGPGRLPGGKHHRARRGALSASLRNAVLRVPRHA